MIVHEPLLTYVIVCPLVFLAGLVDAIGGGGGLISLPAYLLAGVPVHGSIATNKLSSSAGTLISTVRLCRHGKIFLRLMVPAVLLSLAGSFAGSRISLLIDERVLERCLLGVLPVTALLMLRRRSQAAGGSAPSVEAPSGQEGPARAQPVNKPSAAAVRLIVLTAAFVIGMYDGFYGPGTGTFYMIIFVNLACMDPIEAAIDTKLLNLTSNLTSLAVYLYHGECSMLLGGAASVFSIAGHYLGAGMVLKNGNRVIYPVTLLVLMLLGMRILFG